MIAWTLDACYNDKKNANVCFEWPLQLDDKDFPRLLACITIVRDTSK